MPVVKYPRIPVTWLALAAAGLAVGAAALAVAAARSATQLEAVLIGAFIGVALALMPWLLVRIARMVER